jgi:adenylosuccinate lyase
VPEAFLTADAILILLENIFSGIVVHAETARRRLEAELPFLAAEDVLMEAVRRGGDRQDLHERLRVHARASADKRALDGAKSDLLDRIAADTAFGLDSTNVAAAASPARLVGRAAEQVEVFVREELDPALAGAGEAERAEIRV